MHQTTLAEKGAPALINSLDGTHPLGWAASQATY